MSSVADILRHVHTSVSMELAVGLLHLSDRAVNSTASSRSAYRDHTLWDILLYSSVQLGVCVLISEEVDHSALDIQAGDLGSTGRQSLRIYASDIVVAVVEQFQDPRIAEEKIRNVWSHEALSRREPSLAQHGDHGGHVVDHLLAACLSVGPVCGRGIFCRVAGAVIVTDFLFLVSAEVVRVLVHNAAVGEDYLGSHGLFSAGVHVAEFVEISEHDHALSLGRSQVSIKSLPEASLFQVVNGEWALRCNMRRSEALHGVAFAQDRDPALARCYKRCRFLGSLAVFHQHVVSGEHVRGGVSREIAIQKERVKRRELLHRGEQCVGIIKIKSHLSVLLVF